MIKQKKRKRICNRKKERKLSIFIKNILYRETDIDAIKNLLEIIYESIKLQDKKKYMQKSV